MKYYQCEHYGLVYQSDSCHQYRACKKEFDEDGKEYADCKMESCELLNGWAKHLTIKGLIQKAHENAVSKGFWEDVDIEWLRIAIKNPAVSIDINAIGNRLMLIVGELAEAQEGLRHNDRENFKEELADVAIRLADLCGGLDIDLEAEIIKKMEKNKQRPYKHNKAF